MNATHSFPPLNRMPYTGRAKNPTVKVTDPYTGAVYSVPTFCLATGVALTDDDRRWCGWDTHYTREYVVSILGWGGGER